MTGKPRSWVSVCGGGIEGIVLSLKQGAARPEGCVSTEPGKQGPMALKHTLSTGGSLPSRSDSKYLPTTPALPLQGPDVTQQHREERETGSDIKARVVLGSRLAMLPPPAHLYSPKVSSFIGRASESTWVSSLSFTRDTQRAKLLLLSQPVPGHCASFPGVGYG